MTSGRRTKAVLIATAATSAAAITPETITGRVNANRGGLRTSRARRR
jgi:regulator of extracellular matrix RemA (YlzA/DUF370 family)